MISQYISIDKAVIVQVKKELSQVVPMESIAYMDEIRDRIDMFK